MSIEVMLNEKRDLRNKISKIDRDIWESLKRCRTKLDKKTYKVLKLRWYDKSTLEETGKLLGVTKGRVMQIEFKGMLQCDDYLSQKYETK